jgi:hypothetical protein
MATRPTEDDEHWTARQRLRQKRRAEIASLYRQRVEPKLATGCHIPGRAAGPVPKEAHNTSNERINYCGQVMDGTHTAVERLVRGDFYLVGPGGNVGEHNKFEGKSFRCRADQPTPAGEVRSPLMSDGVPRGSIRSTCGGRLMAEQKQRNMGQWKGDLPLKPLIDPLPTHRMGTVVSHQALKASARSLTSTGVEARPITRDEAVDTSCDLAEAETTNTRRPHHCHHKHSPHEHHPHSESVAAPQRQDRPTVRPLPTQRLSKGGARTPSPAPVTGGTRRPSSADGRRPASARPDYMHDTAASRNKETKVVIERPHSARSASSAPAAASARRRALNPYENALHSAREAEGSASVMTMNELDRIRKLAHKPSTPRVAAVSHKPKDTANFLI